MHVGSSPLARGTLEHRPHIKAAPGLIPARAGNTSFPNDGAGIPWAHPRSRGEHEPCLCTQGSRRGSSPLARGTRFFLDFPPFQLGLIPARAGNTQRNDGGGSYVRAHPRSRGEHMDLLGILLVAWGSSPLARGTRALAPTPTDAKGLIPARAGNTVLRSSSPHRVGAHPRSRGEHTRIVTLHALATGSSPLARGTLVDVVIRCAQAGLIPARAGNTLTPPSCSSPKRAHPRSRGEHDSYGDKVIKGAGSSPLARGTRHRRHQSPESNGLIPARAGNTLSVACRSYLSRAHPRSRGEHAPRRTRCQRTGGSSPLARGTPNVDSHAATS